MDDEPKITQEEVWGLFGEMIPMTTAAKLFPKEDVPPMTNKQLREIVETDAKEWWDSGKAQSETIKVRLGRSFANKYEATAFAGELRGLIELYDNFENNEDKAVFPNGVTASVVISNHVILKLVNLKIVEFEDFHRDDNHKFTLQHIRTAVTEYTDLF